MVFGSHSDRVTTRRRTTGAAPGVLPTAILRFLLAMGVTVQLSDLEVALPPCHERIVYVDPTEEQQQNAHRLLSRCSARWQRIASKRGVRANSSGSLGHLRATTTMRRRTRATPRTARGRSAIRSTRRASRRTYCSRSRGSIRAFRLPKERELVRGCARSRRWSQRRGGVHANRPRERLRACSRKELADLDDTARLSQREEGEREEAPGVGHLGEGGRRARACCATTALPQVSMCSLVTSGLHVRRSRTTT